MADASGSRRKKSTRKQDGAAKPSSGRKSGGARKKAAQRKRAPDDAPDDAPGDARADAPGDDAPRKMPRRTPEMRSNTSGSRVVQCYHCRHRFEVSIIAESTTCASCNQRVIVGDVIVDTLRPVARVQTCGRIVVREKARVNAQIVEAHEGVEVLGGLAGNVLSGGHVIIGPRAQWSGDCRAPSLEIHAGARIEQGAFLIPDDSLGLADLPGHDESRPKSARRASRR